MMKVLFILASCLCVVMAAPTVTSVLVTNANGPANAISVPLQSQGNGIIGFAIDGSHDPAVVPTVTLNGANFPAGNYELFFVSARCSGSAVACCNNALGADSARTASSPQNLPAATNSVSFPILPVSRALFYAYSPQYNLISTEGGHMCYKIPDGTVLPVTGTTEPNVKARLYWSCQSHAIVASPRTCGTFLNFGATSETVNVENIQALLSPADYADHRFGRKTAQTRGSATPDAITCECYNPSNPVWAPTCTGPAQRLVDLSKYRCCTASAVIVDKQQPCPCIRTNIVGTETIKNGGGRSTDCDTDAPYCCVAQKFPQLSTANDRGFCFDGVRWGCCDTGSIYDRGSQQCCAINGIQSLDQPCPCTTDAQCTGASLLNGVREAPLANRACCFQRSPALVETEFCTTFVNFPGGQGAATSSRCKGFCINTDYQLCCNGISCLAKYEKCCNTTCCNKFIGTCDKASRGPFKQLFETCSIIQQMNPLRAFWLFIFPAALLLLTLTALALALIFANKAASRHFSLTERWLIVFSILISILIIPLYFSPLYKYGLFIVLLAAWTIITAAVRVRALNVIAVILYIVLLIYLFDPFTGSYYFNLAYFRDPLSGRTDFRANGIWHTTKRLSEPIVNGIPQYHFCTDYFDYFRLDQNLRDIRVDNYRINTFGYCSPQYILALFLFEGFIIICAFILLVLAIIGLVLRFRRKALAPVELDVVRT